MKIVSKFKDYYDSVIAYGQDERCMYLRFKKSFLFPEEEPLYKLIADMPRTTGRHTINGMDTYIIGFCGKIYPVYRFTDTDDWLNHTYTHCYSGEDVVKYLQKNYKKDVVKRYMEGSPDNKAYYHKWYYNIPKFRHEKVEQFLKKNHGREFQSIFEQYKTPVFALWMKSPSSNQPSELEINPCLKDFHFQKIVDPFQAYQLIFQYIAMTFGVGEPEMVDISDKDKRDKHGFDDMSFKKPKTKPKGKRRKNR